MKAKNQIFEVFGIKRNAEKVPVNHVMKSVRPNLFSRTRCLSIVPHTVATIVKIFLDAGLVLFVGKRNAHDGSAFLAMDGKVLGLDDCLNIALDGNIKLRITKVDLAKARANVKQQNANFFPELKVKFYGAKDLEERNQIINGNVTLSQPISYGGRTKATYKLALSNVDRREKEIVKISNTIVTQVKKYYCKLITIRMLKEIQDDAIGKLTFHLRDIERLVEKGLTPPIEALKVQFIIKQAEQQLVVMTNDEKCAALEFNKLMGRALDKGIELKPLPMPSQITLSLDEWIRIGIKNHPELDQGDADINSNNMDLDIAKSQRYPQINVFGSYDRNKDVYVDVSRMLSGVTVEQSLWDWGKTSNGIKQVKTDGEKFVLLKEDKAKDLELELREAYLYYSTAKNEVEISSQACVLAEENLRVQKARFKAGLSSNNEVLEAYTIFLKARGYLITALNAYHVSKADAEFNLNIDSLNEVRPNEAILSDDEFLDLLSRRMFNYFADNQSSTTGLFADTSRGDASIAVTGFGLTALCVGSERGWMAKSEAKRRALKCIKTFAGKLGDKKVVAEGKNGFFYHFLDMQTAKCAGQTEVSSVDTALLLCGVMTAGEYFGGEVKKTADQLYAQVEWDKFYNDSIDMFHMAWTPKEGFLSKWDVYTDEIILVALLGIGSPTFPVNEKAFYSWKRKVDSYKYGPSYICSWQGSLFTYQYAHAWFDFKGKHDREGVDWWVNSINATLTAISFSKENDSKHKTFEDNIWGVTAYDTPHGYDMTQGYPPCVSGRPIYDGTVSPSAPAGSIVFAPKESIALLRKMYRDFPELWGPYGLRDSFNLDTNWFSKKYFGLSIGISLLMVENYRTGFVWKTFMKNKYVNEALRKTGFCDNVRP